MMTSQIGIGGGPGPELNGSGMDFTLTKQPACSLGFAEGGMVLDGAKVL